MLTLEKADQILEQTLLEGERQGLNPLCAVVLDAGGHVLSLKRHEAASINRPEIAIGKASGCLGLGLGGRAVAKIASERPSFAASLSDIFPKGCVPAPGGVLIRDKDGAVLGAVGVTGDLSEKDEECAVYGIKTLNLNADTGH